MEKDIDKIRAIIDAMSLRYKGRGGDLRFAGVEGGTVKITPAGFCWR